MNHHNTRYAYGRKSGELTIVDARDILGAIRISNSKDARKEEIIQFGGINGSFMCCYGDELIFHDYKNGHYQHKSKRNIGKSNVNMTCCPCQNKDHETQKESISILVKILANPSISVIFHQFCENGLHGIIVNIPNNVTVKLSEQTTGKPGFKSGEIVPNISVYDDAGRNFMLLETSKTNRKNSESRPNNTIEIDPQHVIYMYEKFIKEGSGEIVLNPITRIDGTCHECIAFEQRKRKEEEVRLRKIEEEVKRRCKIQEENQRRCKIQEENERLRKIEKKRPRKIEEERLRKIEEERLRKIEEERRYQIDLNKKDNAELQRSFHNIQYAYRLVHELDIPNGKTFKWRKDNLGPIKFSEEMDKVTKKYGDKNEIAIAYNLLKAEMETENKAKQDRVNKERMEREQKKDEIEKCQVQNLQPGFTHRVSGSDYVVSQDEIDIRRAERMKRKEEERIAKNQKKRKL